VISKPDKSAPTGIAEVQKATVGPTAKDFKLSKPCFTP
jgi:hypothetical protein